MNAAFDNSYSRLPERFYARVKPAQVPAPRLVHLNEPLAFELGLDPTLLRSESGVQVLSGNRVPEGADPLAMAYAGHQFGNWVPQLGDGRAVLLGEVIDKAGVRRDIQLKGAGRTPFSRMGDGRAVLGPALREYIVSEAMTALGIPSTRGLAVVTTGDLVRREGPKPGAVFTRVATSHVRIGTFEYFANRGDQEAVKTLADYVIARHYPQAADGGQPYLALLRAVIARTAMLIARWQCVGFIHGVMNTDNMSIAAETIDYGPCAFMDHYDPRTVYSSIDHAGRYAYLNQPRIAQWNLARLALSLLPLLDADENAAIAAAQDALSGFVAAFEDAYRTELLAKLGISSARDGDESLVQELLELMAAQRADFTLTFRRLTHLAADPRAAEPLQALFADPAPLQAWVERWQTRWREELPAQVAARMRRHNPAFIPRNHRVQAVIEAAEEQGDFAPLQQLLAVLARPYEDQPAFEAFTRPPEPHEVVQATFCGT